MGYHTISISRFELRDGADMDVLPDTEQVHLLVASKGEGDSR